ncbi:hypothetical protein TB1_035745 [Malus domestica]
MAKRLEGLMGMDKRVSPLASSNKAPTPSDETRVINEVNCKFLEAINASGRVYMTHAMVGGIHVLRCAVQVLYMEEKHVVMGWKAVQKHADAILSMYC